MRARTSSNASAHDVAVSASNLLAVHRPPGSVTRQGLETNVSVGLRYLISWLQGTGAAAIDDLMEDAATAEISRAQIWQWVHHDVELADGTEVTGALVERLLAEHAQRALDEGVPAEIVSMARALFKQVALSDEFIDFLTLPAYGYLA